MSRTLLHNWECSIEKNINNTEELLKIAEDIYNTAYARGKASEERPQGEWLKDGVGQFKCSLCGRAICTSISNDKPYEDFPFCHCGADMRDKEE